MGRVGAAGDLHVVPQEPPKTQPESLAQLEWPFELLVLQVTGTRVQLGARPLDQPVKEPLGVTSARPPASTQVVPRESTMLITSVSMLFVAGLQASHRKSTAQVISLPQGLPGL